jgi:hypothetical protein
MDQLSTTAAANTNEETVLHDLFALSDEQILEIEPETGVARSESQTASEPAPAKQTPVNRTEDAAPSPAFSTSQTVPVSYESSVTNRGALEPPAWLAAQMQDPWGGEEAREFWDGVQQARSEAAAYRGAIASPEDARALKELYPGGVSEARAAAERARLLDEVDRAYFGADGTSPEQLSASRAQLAQRMMREDPAAFREMVEAGIRVLQETASAQGPTRKSLAIGNDPALVMAQNAVPLEGNQPATAFAKTQGQARVAAYAAFERAANEDLERSIGGAIERTLTQALPSIEQHNAPGLAVAQRAAPLQEKLASSIRAEVEKALQGDRQLGEQVAQILASRRFDSDARAQIVRLINERAQQLVPGAAKRVLNEWTQTTLAAHRGRTQRTETMSPRADVALASVPARTVSDQKIQTRRQDASATRSQPINYCKVSDEQILEM